MLMVVGDVEYCERFAVGWTVTVDRYRNFLL